MLPRPYRPPVRTRYSALREDDHGL